MKNNKYYVTFFTAVVCLFCFSYVSAYNIDWQVISAGGTDGSSANYDLQGTASQTAIGTGASANYGVVHGFWQGVIRECLVGDADGSGAIDISDAVYLIAYIFGGGPPPVPNVVASGDADCSGAVDISDAVYLIAFIFGGGPLPGDPNNDGVADCICTY